MRSELARLLARQDAVARREDASTPWLLSNAARAGKVVQLFPGVYVEKQRRHEEHVRRVAAQRYVNGRGALSHTTALAVWRIGWDEPHRAPIHATVPPAVRLPGTKGLVLHRHRGFRETSRPGGLTVVPLDEALVRSWPLLPASKRAGVVIDVIIGRHLTAPAVIRRLAETPKLAGAGELRRVLELLAAGCHSPLELWGALHVFTGPGMPPLRRQYPVSGYYLDLYAERERVAFELDGTAYHGSVVQRERDLRRDATLAALGIQVVRFTYDRLMSEPDEVRRQALAILAARRTR